MSFENRLISLTKKNEINGCIEFTGCKNSSGYGKIRNQFGKMEGAHRCSYMHYIGEIPKDMQVLHKCDNRVCTNPEHLFLGTNQDNVTDKMMKNRFIASRGEDNGQSTLTKQEVMQIRFLGKTNLPQRHKNRISSTMLAKKYNVHFSTICRILTGDTWEVA